MINDLGKGHIYGLIFRQQQGPQLAGVIVPGNNVQEMVDRHQAVINGMYNDIPNYW